MEISLVLSAIRAVIRYRARVDQVLSLNEASSGLPFRLPPPPQDLGRFEQDMLAFFQTDRGRVLLELHGLMDAFREVLDSFKPGRTRWGTRIDDCLRLYVEASEIKPETLLPGAPPGELRKNASSGPSEDMRLAYYVVESDRLSRNAALTRIVLISADTLLEVMGENASIFVSKPKTRDIVESLLKEFAGKGDFDDESARDIFRQLIGATAMAVLDHPEHLPNKPALTALYGALNDARKAIKDKPGSSDSRAHEVMARLMTREGFERVVNAYLAQVAKDPSFVTSSEVARKAISAALLEIEGKFFDLFKDDPAARYRVLEAVIAVGAEHVQGLLAREVKPGRPFTAAVLSALVASVGTQAGGHVLVDAIKQGELFGDLYAVALAAVAASGSQLRTEAQVSQVVADLVTALAGQLSSVPIGAMASSDTQRKLLSSALKVLSRHSGVLAADRRFASRVLASSLAAAADAVAEGMSIEDAETVFDAAMQSVGENAGLAGFDEAEAAALQAVTAVVAKAKLRELATPAARKTLLLEAIGEVNANPKVWSDAHARVLLQPLLEAIIEVAKQGRTRMLFSESTMLEGVQRMLAAASKRARALTERGDKGPEELRQILLKGLDFADEEIGRRLSHADVPALLERVILAFLKAPFAVAEVAQTEIDRLFDEIRQWLEGR
jgi:hypothetical protein